jgi:DNA-binding beta-propeller fold protein YncE
MSRRQGPARSISGSLAACAIALIWAAAPAHAAGGFGEIQGAGGCLRNSDTAPEGSCAEGKGLFHPKAIAVSPDGTSVYVVGGVAGNDVAESFGTVTILKRNPTTGELSDSGCLSSDGTDGQDGASGVCTPTPGLLGADGVTVSADGHTVFVTAHSSASVVAFAREPATGSLTLLGCLKSTPRPGSSCTGANIFDGSEDLLTSANDSALYVASPLEGVISAFTAPPAATSSQSSGSTTTGTAQSLTSTTAVPSSETVAGSSARLASLFTPTAGPSLANPCIAVNGYDGSCAVGVAMKGVQGLTLGPEGKQLYAVAAKSDAIDIFTPAEAQPLAETGCIMASAPAGLCSSSALLQSPTQIAISPDGHNAYVADSGRTGGKIDLFSRNAATGGLADLGCVDYLPQPAKTEPGNEEQEEQQEKQEKEEAAKREQEQEASDTCVRVPGLESVHTIAISDDGSAVYAFGTSSAVSFARDPSTGKLTETACASNTDTRCAALSDLDGVEAAAVSPDGQNVYVVTNNNKSLLAFGIGASVTSASAAATHGGLAQVSVVCPARLGHTCRGQLLLTRRVALRTRGGRPDRTVRVSAGRSDAFAIAPGHRGVVTMRLDRSARGLLARRRRLRVTAVVSASRFSGGSGFGHTLVLALARR